MKIQYLSIIFFVFLTSNVFGAWQGPSEIVTASFGSATSQIGIEYGDSFDRVPKLFVVDGGGNIIIGDEVNRRIVIFKNDGSLLGTLTTSIDLIKVKIVYWPYNLAVLDGNKIVIETEGHLQVFNYQGERLSEYTISLDYFVEKVNPDGSIFFKSKTNYVLYSPTGQLIKTSAERPLELGRVAEQPLSGGRYKITITYPDVTYSILGGPFEKYQRDAAGKLNAVSGKLVKKYNQCGKTLGTLVIPQNESTLISPGGRGFEERRQLISEYGEPVIAPNGDIYTWKRTPDKYSILKWTWVDDPNVPTGPDAPTGLSVMPSTTGLYLTWTASPQDPGCVTGYEIVRGTSAGGVYSTLTTVDKGIIKYNDTTAAAGTTYYYKVRGAAGNEYSPYTSEVSGKR